MHAYTHTHTWTRTSALEILPQPVMNIFFSSFELRYACGSVCCHCACVHICSLLMCACVCLCMVILQSISFIPNGIVAPKMRPKDKLHRTVRLLRAREMETIFWLLELCPSVGRHWLVRPERETSLTLTAAAAAASSIPAVTVAVVVFRFLVYLNRPKRKTKILYKRQTLVVRCEWPCLCFAVYRIYWCCSTSARMCAVQTHTSRSECRTLYAATLIPYAFAYYY